MMKKSVAMSCMMAECDVVEVQVEMKAEVKYHISDEGRLVLSFPAQITDDCPAELSRAVQSWCQEQGVNENVLLDAMLDAVYKEQIVALFRKAMV
jgi:predicted ATP-grasp superfamily ATP-dependent carboligase